MISHHASPLKATSNSWRLGLDQRALTVDVGLPEVMHVRSVAERVETAAGEVLRGVVQHVRHPAARAAGHVLT